MKISSISIYGTEASSLSVLSSQNSIVASFIVYAWHPTTFCQSGVYGCFAYISTFNYSIYEFNNGEYSL